MSAWLDFPASDRKSTRLNSSHDQISYAVFCLKKKKNERYAAMATADIRVALTPEGFKRTGVDGLAGTHRLLFSLPPGSPVFFLMIRLPPISTLFPYTTLFR